MILNEELINFHGVEIDGGVDGNGKEESALLGNGGVDAGIGRGIEKEKIRRKEQKVKEKVKMVLWGIEVIDGIEIEIGIAAIEITNVIRFLLN